MARPSRCAFVLAGLLALSTASRAATGPWLLRVEAGTTDYSKQMFSGHSLGHTEFSLDGGKGFGVARVSAFIWFQQSSPTGWEEPAPE